ncbi:MAG: site-specific integrase [Treponema sp.]|nr:site-specific integrase [Treponema sp.]
MRTRNNEFGIFPRRSRKTILYYYWIYDCNGKRKYRSTGKQDYYEAIKFCRSLLIKGQLYLGTSYSFKSYTEDFFIYDKCPYIKSRLLRGYSYGKTWAKKERSLLVKYIQPYFKETDIRTISQNMIDNFILSLKESNIGVKTCCHIISAIKVIFKYANKTGVIETNPAEGVLPFKNNVIEKGIFTREELILLFSNPERLCIWDNSMQFLLNCIAANTGMRLGEVLALRPDNISEKKIIIEYSWNEIEGLKSTKTGKKRIVPISTGLGEAIRSYIINNKIKGYIFSANEGKTPISHKMVYKYFWKALSKIGICKDTRKMKNISFHSYRHTFNTMLLESNINPELIRLVTGHTVNMTSRYSHVQLGNLPGISEKLNIFND